MVWKAAWSVILGLFFAGIALLYIGYEAPHTSSSKPFLASQAARRESQGSETVSVWPRNSVGSEIARPASREHATLYEEGSTGIGGGEPTAEQLAQRHANMIHRLSKRIAGDVRAKEALKTALTQWTASLGHHLAALVPRIQAISQKLDDDLSEACQEMQTAAVLSATSQEKIQHAQAQLGPTWTALQEQEIYRIAGALRAFGAVQPSAQPIPHISGLDGGVTTSTVPLLGRGLEANPAPLQGLMSPMSSSSTLTLGKAAPAMGSGMATATTSFPESRVSRWQKRPAKSGSDRPGKSPRRDVQPPWSHVATGRTLEGIPRTAATEIEEDVELIPDLTQPSEPPSWFTAWLQVISFAVSQGSDLIGELASNAEQNSMLPLHPDSQLEDATVAQAHVLWLELGQMVATPNEGSMAGLYARLRDFLQMVRLCPNALPRVQQGLVLALQVTLGNILDPYSYAPSTAQEWLYPSLLLEHGGEVTVVVASLPIVPDFPGRALEVSICRAIGRQAAEWECYRLLEALPALPPEQYVLRRTSVSWHLSIVPVDLRPIGGPISLAYADRVMPCGAIAHMAIADQPALGCPEDFLCRTSQGWFAPDAALLLLPHCDAFQVWPLQLAQAAPPPTTLSLLRQSSGSELFAESLEPTEGAERASTDDFVGQGVIIASNGLVYVTITAFADQDSIRSNALFAYLGPSGLGIEYGGLTHFARVLPPLPALPAVQFVAGNCDGHAQPSVVDFRAIQGSLQVCCTEPDATPAQRIEAAIQGSGEPDPANPVIARLSQGLLQALHREQAVSPFVPLTAPPPTPLVVLPRRPNVGTGWGDEVLLTAADLGLVRLKVKLGLDYARARLLGWRPGLVLTEAAIGTLAVVGSGGYLLSRFPSLALLTVVYASLDAYYCRAAVVAVPPGYLDWARLAQLALDHFGADIFRRNAFSIQHQSYVFSYGTNVPMPSHGAILHLVRSIQAPSTSFSTWENVPETVGMLHFEYDICEGPGGERCLQPDFAADNSGTTLSHASMPASTRPATAPSALLTRQVNEVVAQVETLTLRLETAGILPASTDPAAAAWEEEQATSGDGTSASWIPVDEAQSGSSQACQQLSPVVGLFIGWHVRKPGLGLLLGYILLVRGDGDECSSEDSPEPPSSPDLTEVQPPTPVTVPPNGGHGVNEPDAIVRPSDSDLARTSIPRVETAFVGAPAFDLATIPALQRRVAAALAEVDTEAFSRPFLPAGCPVVMHNPFTARGALRILCLQRIITREPEIGWATLEEEGSPGPMGSLPCAVQPPLSNPAPVLLLLFPPGLGSVDGGLMLKLESLLLCAAVGSYRCRVGVLLQEEDRPMRVFHQVLQPELSVDDAYIALSGAAVDWRNGDVLLAWEWHDSTTSPIAPSLGSHPLGTMAA
ncbi:hypothetical protein AK812_SmicGene10271 [Symbiodinium microadriaticum]|uniref:Uncharacterized protein n=1 Tax=Symbiodinium microadriaticum TaxID=2951 RepID=A0A1Q9EGD6_SYMMI|nr:hypothetical protein AK812_SmicGene10271 [Symbiodinium microadriaticum]